MAKVRLTCACGYEVTTRLPNTHIKWHQQECDGVMEIHDV